MKGPDAAKGAAIASSAFGPPAAPAGKNFATRAPWRAAADTSLGVMTPGAKGKFAFAAASTICASKPGARPKRAPLFRAASSEARSSTVPAPMSNRGRSADSFAITRAAAGVRKVISATGNPPSRSASASKIASSIRSMAITGTMPISAISRNGSGIAVGGLIDGLKACPLPSGCPAHDACRCSRPARRRRWRSA